nr:GNAT family N-acetyltransferase [Xanthomonas campestris]
MPSAFRCASASIRASRRPRGCVQACRWWWPSTPPSAPSKQRSRYHAAMTVLAPFPVHWRAVRFAELDTTDDGALAAYLRVLPPGLSYPEPSIGRVVIAAAHRGHGLAHVLLREGLRLVQAQWPGRAVQLGAQTHLQHVYAAHGFAPTSAPYLEDGIPHIDMLRRADAATQELA